MKKELFTLSNPQNSIWVTEQFYPNTNINNICGIFQFNTKIDIDTLKKSIQLLVQQNEALRLRIVLQDGKPMQYVADFESFDVPVQFIKKETELDNLKQNMANNPIDILDSPLFRFTIFQSSNGVGGYVVTVHHLAADALTLGLIGNQTYEIYQALCKKETIPTSSYSYLHYLQTEQEYVTSEKYKKDETFWNEVYSIIPETATIPATKQENVENFHAQRMTFTISKEKTDEMKAYCNQHRISLYHFFMSIFSLYIGRVSNLEDFVVGTPILNRTNYKEKNTFGMFISNLPFRVTMNSDNTFVEYARTIATNLTTMLRHQRYPYQFLLENLRKKDASIPNLYNITLSYQITKASAAGSGCSTDWIPTNTIADDMAIHFYDLDYAGHLQIAYDYQTSKYEQDEIEKIQERIQYMIEQILVNDNIVMKNIEIVTPKEKQQILVDFNDTKMDYPRDKTIVELFEEQVEKTPDNIAVVFGEETLTYRELNEKANALSYLLLSKNCSGIVGIHLEKDLDYVIAIFATLKSNAAFLPISSSLPSDRISYMITNSGITTIISNHNLSTKIPSTIKTCLYLDDINLKKNKKNPNLCKKPQHLAYVLFTSGSTGLPKGVMVSHSALMNHIWGIYYKFKEQISANDIALSIANTSFDANIQELFIPLVFGACLHLLESNSIYNLHYLSQYIINHKITFSYIPPTILDDLYELLKNPSIVLNKLLVGVESIPSATLNRFLSLNKNMMIHNGYGPTEATICCVSYLYESPYSFTKMVPIGTPMANTKVFILNPQTLQVQPPYAMGEIFISGDCLSEGYIHCPDLTDKHFMYIPYCHSKSYRTGDFAYYLPNGNIMFVGRMDSQVKIHGYRIELDEINHVLQSVLNIKRAITLPFKHNALYSYVISADGSHIDTFCLKSYLKSKLPSYMLPNNIIQIDRIPTTSNGKIDREVLSQLIEKKQEIRTIKKPSTIIQKELLSVCQQWIAKDSISIDDDLFEIGADSLTAIRLAAFIKQKFNCDISVRTIFENSSIESLSTLIPSNARLNTFKVKSIDSSQPYYPLSSAQKRIYFSTSISDNTSTTYNTPGGVFLNKLPDKVKLENCICTLINRHESFRTSFHIVNGTVMQKIHPFINSYSLPVKKGKLEDKYTFFQQFVKPFDLTLAPLLRLQLIQFEDDSCLLLLDMHHIISDGLSMQIFVQELSKLYNNCTLPELTLTYKDYIAWEEKFLLSSAISKSKSFWMKQFADFPPTLNLPTISNHPNTLSFKGSNIYINLDILLSKQILCFIKKQNITPYMFFLSAYYILLYYYTLQTDIVIGSPTIGREQIEFSNIIGMFVNMLALRHQINPKQSITDFLLQIKEYCLQAFAHQSYPFNELVNQLNLDRSCNQNPLFNTSFIYQNNGYKELTFKDIIATYYIPDSNVSKFDLSLEIVPDNDFFKLRFEYSTDLFNSSFINTFASHYLELLKSMIKDSTQKIEDISFITEEEKQIILGQFNDTKTDYPKESTLAQIFELQARKTPNKYAIYFEGTRLTYRELDQKANQMANYLISNSVKSGDIVCLLLDKSIEMIIAILGILKAGAAFLPIDIDYPKERIDYIIKDSRAQILLTTISFINKSNTTITPIAISSSLLENISTDSPNVLGKSTDLAYIMYTSGSTGSPKGVMISQRNVIRLVKNTNYITFQENDRILQTGSIVFDACTFEIWSALLNGLELYIIKKDSLLDTNLLQNYLVTHKITILWLTAPLFNQLCEDSPHMFSTVRYLLTGGDVLSPKHINLVRTSNPKLTIINGYGPTENTTFSCCFPIHQSYTKNIPIGYPISNSTCYIVSPNGTLLPIGVPGELWVGGDGVGKGYLNNSNLTTEKFVKNPFHKGVLYKTGDLARWLPDGSIEFLGRIDSQVKIHGYRVELTEINSAILNYYGMHDSYTTTHWINNEKQICSYIVADSPIDMMDLKLHLKRSLPTYMIPNYIMQLEKLPLNQNGKVDKNLLPTKFHNTIKEKRFSELPSTKEENILLSIFKKVLNISDIGITDNFFELGGDSLSAMKVHVECLSHHLNINYANIFQYPTIKELAKSIGISSLTQNLEQYDYEKYDSILKTNTSSQITVSPYHSIGNILLTGFTGFLGAHVLDSFMKQERGIIYCLIRNKNNMTAEERLKNVLHFYFNTKYDKYIGNRIRLVKGDITYEHLGLSALNYQNLGKNISSVIHCAALVKHFGSYHEFQTINIYGTQQIVDLCKQFKLKLLHISTISVSGNVFAEDSYLQHTFTEDVHYTEQDFYIGQNLDNFYVKSKFLAEKIVFDAILEGLQAYVIRMGNLTSRFTEGKFQQNHFENAFVNRFKSMLQIRKVPDYLLEGYVEFTPIDYCGDAIIKLANHFNKSFTVFHLLNPKHVEMDRLFHTMKSLQIDIDIVSSEEFTHIIDTLLQDDKKKSYLEGIINDLNEKKELVYESPVKVHSDFSCKYLKEIGFEWPYIDERYIKNYLKYLSDIGYFDIQLD